MLLLAVLAWSAPALTAARPIPRGSETPEMLSRLGSPVRRLILGGQAHRYQVLLGDREYVEVMVRQLGVDVAISLISPDGKELVSIDTPTRTQGFEKASWVSGPAGPIDIEVRALEAQEGGFYEIEIEALRRAEPADREWLIAQEAFSTARRAQERQDEPSQHEALRLLRQASMIWREKGDAYRAAIALHCISDAFSALGDYDGAMSCYEDALDLRRAAADLWGEADTLSNLGGVETSVGKTSRALEHFEAALRIERELGDQRMEAEVLMNMGKLHDSVGEKEAAMREYAEALPLIRAARVRSAEVRILNRIATLHESSGQKQRALDLYLQALRLNQELGNQVYEAVISGNVGRVYADLGESEKAGRYLRQSLAATRRLGDHHSEAATLVDLGKVSADGGDLPSARDSYAQALPLLHAVEDPRLEATALNYLGQTYVRDSLWENATPYFERALIVARSASDPYREADSLTNLGAARARTGQPEEGVRDLQQALDLRKRVSDRLGQAWSSYELARVYRGRGRVAEARALLEDSLRCVESLRATVASASTRASFFGSAQKYYEFYIDLLMSVEPRDAESVRSAFETSERARARSLLDLLTEARAEIRQGVEVTLLERERALRHRLNEKLQQQIQLIGASRSDRRVEALDREIESLGADLEQLETEVRTSSPRYASLIRPEPVDLPTIVSLIGDDTLLLEYSLGAERSFLWTVTAGVLEAYELPPRSEIEARARELHSEFAHFGAPGHLGGGSSVRVSQKLSQILLGPVRNQLRRKRLVIVADGALEYVPFAVLPDPAGGRPLVFNHEIVYAPSASVLVVQRRELAGRRPAPRAVAVFADPVFDREDERVARASAGRVGRLPHRGSAEPANERVSSVRDLPAADEEPGLSRLPFTRREGRAILELVPASDRKEAFDFEASVATAKSEDLSRYRYVHFATHGFLHTVHPELSGLVLSLVDREGRDQEGFLPVMEVFNLKLPAELVVLSACRTALGKEIRGEGLVGLTRAFMYAGARRVVASLWRVDDAATAELMRKFYEGMLGPRKVRPPAALREAQLAVRRQKRWEHPYYWAGFTLLGQWD